MKEKKFKKVVKWDNKDYFPEGYSSTKSLKEIFTKSFSIILAGLLWIPFSVIYIPISICSYFVDRKVYWREIK